MKFTRIWAIILRYLYLMRRSYDRSFDIFYWPTVDLVVWGLTSTYFQGATGSNQTIMVNIVGSLILWYVIWRCQYEISVGFLEDLWNKNLINIFVSPLMFREWIMSFFIGGVIKMMITGVFMSTLAYFIYGINIFRYGYYLLAMVPLLIITGWTIGLIIASLILRFGTKIQILAWSLPYLINPFSAVFFPLSLLPETAKNIAMFIPSSYIFELGREIISTGHGDTNKLVISFFLNIIYFTFALILTRKSFDKVLEKGLVKLY